jgi:hypothetical protein
MITASVPDLAANHPILPRAVFSLNGLLTVLPILQKGVFNEHLMDETLRVLRAVVYLCGMFSI